jgi:hypothetical protein
VSLKKPAAKSKSKDKTSHSSGAATAVKRKPSAHGCPTEGKDATKGTDLVMDGRMGADRRQSDRRQGDEQVGAERRTGERRVKVNRRRQIDPTTCERDYSPDEVEFMHALDDYKRRSGRMFPTCSEVLEVIKGLGYEKRAEVPTAMLATAPITIVAAATEQAV